jgi:hypothetical protein
MTTLIIRFPKLGQQTSTWVDDEWWSSLTRAQQEGCIRRFVKNAYPTELMNSKQVKYKAWRDDYTWTVL